MSKDISKLIPIKKAVFDYRKGIVVRTYYISPEKYLKELLKIRTQLQPVYYKLHNHLKIALYNNDLVSLKKELGLTNTEYEFLLKSLIEYKQKRYINNIVESDKNQSFSISFLSKLNTSTFKADKLQYLQNSWFNFSLTNEDKKFIKENELNIRTKFIKPLSEFTTFTPQYKYKEIKYKLSRKNIKVNKKQIKKSSLKSIKQILEQTNTITKGNNYNIIDIYKEFKKFVNDSNGRKNKNVNENNNTNSNYVNVLKDYFFSLTLKPEKSINPYITGKEISKIINFINLSDGKFITWLFSFVPQNKPIDDNQKHQLKNMFFGLHYFTKDKQFYGSLLNKVILDTLDFYINELFENPKEYNNKYIVDFYNTFWQILILYKLDKIRFLSIVNDRTLNELFNNSLSLFYRLVKEIKEFDKTFNELKEKIERIDTQVIQIINGYIQNNNTKIEKEIIDEIINFIQQNGIEFSTNERLNLYSNLTEFKNIIRNKLVDYKQNIISEKLFRILTTLNELKERIIELFVENGISEHYVSDFYEFINLYNVLAFLSKNHLFLENLCFDMDYILKLLTSYVVKRNDLDKFQILKKSILLKNLRTDINKNDSFVLDYLIWLDLNFINKDINISYLFFRRFIEPYVLETFVVDNEVKFENKNIKKIIDVFETVDKKQFEEIEPIYIIIQFLFSKYLKNIPEFPYEKNILFRLKPTWNPYSTYFIIRNIRDILKDYGHIIFKEIEEYLNIKSELKRNNNNLENLYIVLYRERLTLLNYYELKEFNTLEEIKKFKQQNLFVRIYKLKDIIDKNFNGNIDKIKGIYKNLILFFNIVEK